jgi:hypothetical protein
MLISGNTGGGGKAARKVCTKVWVLGRLLFISIYCKACPGGLEHEFSGISGHQWRYCVGIGRNGSMH